MEDQRATSASPPPLPAPKKPPDEMHDLPEDLRRPDALGEYLRLCDPNPEEKPQACRRRPAGEGRPSLRYAFDESDLCAIKRQNAYRRATFWTVFLGSLALLITLLQLVGWEGLLEALVLRFPLLGSPKAVEIGVTGICCALVLLGLYLFRHEEWLVDRSKAERLRALKFRFLIDPRLWKKPSDDVADSTAVGTVEWRRQFDLEVLRVDSIAHEELDQMKIIGELPHLPAAADCLEVVKESAASLRTLCAYYVPRRLEHQIVYFYGKTKRLRPDNPRLLPIVFFGGVFAAFLHAVSAVKLFAFLSLLMPMAWGAVRTWRSAHENTRNLNRSRARHDQLTEISKNLSKQLARSDTRLDPVAVFQNLYLAEFILAEDHREWLRLMKEAEWYG